MRRFFIALVCLLTCSTIGFSGFAATAAGMISDAHMLEVGFAPYSIDRHKSDAQGTAVAHEGQSFGINPANVCAQGGLRLSHHENLPACTTQTGYSPWGWRGQVMAAPAIFPELQSCSLIEISQVRAQWRTVTQHYRDYVRVAMGDKRGLGSSWISYVPGLDDEYPMCRTGAKRGTDRGPNPFEKNAQRVQLGPSDAGQPYGAIATAPAQIHQTPYTSTSVSHGTTLSSLSPAYSAMTPLPMAGLAMYYNPGIMRQVVEYRENMGEIETCDECVGYAALLRAGDLNRKIWIEWTDGTVEGPFLVADVAARHHVDMLIQRGWAVDVDNQTAMRHGMFMPVAVTVMAAPPSPNTAHVATD